MPKKLFKNFFCGKCKDEKIVIEYESESKYNRFNKEEYQLILNEGFNTKKYYVRHCGSKYQDVLVKDKSANIRCEVAQYGTNKHLDILVYDKSWWVRCKVAEFGNNEQHDILVHDEDYDVRFHVAKYGANRHRDILMNDSSYTVRSAVAKYGTNKHRDVLAYDKHAGVRETVAKFGNNNHRNILVDDEDEMVSLIAKKFMGAETHILSKNFGTYDGDNLITIIGDKYVIKSGCYEASSLEEWIEKAKSRGLSDTVIKTEVDKISNLLNNKGECKL